MTTRGYEAALIVPEPRQEDSAAGVRALCQLLLDHPYLTTVLHLAFVFDHELPFFWASFRV